MSNEKFLEKMLDKYEIKSDKIKDIKNILSDKDNITGNHKSNPQKPNLDRISSHTETALQRAIFNNGYSELENTNEKIEWIDLEIPVVLNNKSRKRCVDLIGISGKNLIITELKFGNSSAQTNNPYYGIFELAVYYHFLTKNYKKLDEYKVYHKIKEVEEKKFFWEKYISSKNVKLIFAANEGYFEYWINSRKIDINDLHLLIKDIGDNYGVSFEIYCMKDEDFKKQKMENASNDKGYKPIIENKNRWCRK